MIVEVSLDIFWKTNLKRKGETRPSQNDECVQSGFHFTVQWYPSILLIAHSYHRPILLPRYFGYLEKRDNRSFVFIFAIVSSLCLTLSFFCCFGVFFVGCRIFVFLSRVSSRGIVSCLWFYWFFLGVVVVSSCWFCGRYCLRVKRLIKVVAKECLSLLYVRRWWFLWIK